MGIFPVVNAATFASVKKTVDAIKTFLPEGSFVHCDIADGTFTFNRTWNNPTEWANLRAPYHLEAHLMVDHPERFIEPWIAAGVARFIIHVETITEETLSEIFEKCGRRGVGVVLTSNPETPREKIEPYLKYFLMVQVLCVHPGLSGQKFLPLMLDKISWIRKEWPHVIIEVDGGINLETARQARAAGADFAVSSSYIFGDNGGSGAGDISNDGGGVDPKARYEALMNL